MALLKARPFFVSITKSSLYFCFPVSITQQEDKKHIVFDNKTPNEFIRWPLDQLWMLCEELCQWKSVRVLLILASYIAEIYIYIYFIIHERSGYSIHVTE